MFNYLTKVERVFKSMRYQDIGGEVGAKPLITTRLDLGRGVRIKAVPPD
jgi:hypothetical protein